MPAIVSVYELRNYGNVLEKVAVGSPLVFARRKKKAGFLKKISVAIFMTEGMKTDELSGAYRRNGNGLVKPSVGIENFNDVRTRGVYYVDKTAMIRDLLDRWSKVNLFTRLRRFGK